MPCKLDERAHDKEDHFVAMIYSEKLNFGEILQRKFLIRVDLEYFLPDDWLFHPKFHLG